MYPVSAQFLDAVRNPPRIVTRVEVWRAGARVDTYGEPGLPIYGGEITVDASKQVRRTLSGATVDATDAMWDLLSPVGTRLRVWRGFQYLNRERDLVPVGRFVLDDLAENYGDNWQGQIGSAPDLMALVQRARFPVPRTFPAGTRIVDIIVTLLSEVVGPVAVLTDADDTISSPMVGDRDRGKCIASLATSIGADVFIAPDGTPTVRPAPQLGDIVWTVDGGGDAPILYSGSRSRSMARTYSAVVATQSGVSGDPTFEPQIVYDDDPDSPTYYLGPFGLVPYFMASEFFTTASQALTAAAARLPLVTAIRAQLDLEAECNPALADGDTIQVRLPRRGRGQTAVTERHLVGSLTVPLTPDGTQKIATLSATADVEDSA